MPLPLVPIVVGGLAAVVAVAISKLPIRSRPKRVVILGKQKVGKRTLLNFLLESDNAAQPVKSPIDGSRRTFHMDVGGKVVNLDVPKDLSGIHELVFSNWKEEFLKADYVWYLFRSDLIVRGDSSEINIVRGHLDMFKEWMDSNWHARPKIILVGTWADKEHRFQQDPETFKLDVSSARPIKAGVVKLHGAGLAVGSLLSDTEKKALVASLGRRMG